MSAFGLFSPAELSLRWRLVNTSRLFCTNQFNRLEHLDKLSSAKPIASGAPNCREQTAPSLQARAPLRSRRTVPRRPADTGRDNRWRRECALVQRAQASVAGKTDSTSRLKLRTNFCECNRQRGVGAVRHARVNSAVPNKRESPRPS